MIRVSGLLVGVAAFFASPVFSQNALVRFFEQLAPENYPWKLSGHDSLVITDYVVQANTIDALKATEMSRVPLKRRVFRYGPQLIEGIEFLQKDRKWCCRSTLHPDTAYHSLQHERNWFIKLTKERGIEQRIDTSVTIGFNGGQVVKLYYVRPDTLDGKTITRVEQYTFDAERSEYQYEVFGGFASGMSLSLQPDVASSPVLVMREKFNAHGDKTYDLDARWSELARRASMTTLAPLETTITYRYNDEGFWTERLRSGSDGNMEMTRRELF